MSRSTMSPATDAGGDVGGELGVAVDGDADVPAGDGAPDGEAVAPPSGEVVEVEAGPAEVAAGTGGRDPGAGLAAAPAHPELNAPSSNSNTLIRILTAVVLRRRAAPSAPL